MDANDKFDRDAALACARALRPFGLRWFEEPCHPLDDALCAEVASVYDARLATGESLYSTEDMQNLVQFGACGPASTSSRSIRPRPVAWPSMRRPRHSGGKRLAPHIALSPWRVVAVMHVHPLESRNGVLTGGAASRADRRETAPSSSRHQGWDSAKMWSWPWFVELGSVMLSTVLVESSGTVVAKTYMLLAWLVPLV